jgi:hypothetical protein
MKNKSYSKVSEVATSIKIKYMEIRITQYIKDYSLLK